jgi:hypothetical protein
VRTPAGAECGFYYEDLHRGAERRECRAPRNPGSLAWRPKDCERCPVPEILRRAGSPDLGVRITIRSLPLGLSRTVRVESWCDRHMLDIAEPLAGCPACRAESEGLLRAALEGDAPAPEAPAEAPSD